MYPNHDDFQVLEFYCSFTQSKVHLSDGIDRESTFQNQTHFLSQYKLFCAQIQFPV